MMIENLIKDGRPSGCYVNSVSFTVLTYEILHDDNVTLKPC